MPELPDLELYLGALEPRIGGQGVRGVRVPSPFVVRTTEPPIAAVTGRIVGSLSRLGKRIVLHLEPDLHLIVHLMIAGRLRWLAPGRPLPRRLAQLALDFDHGTLVLTEAGSHRRAAVHLVRGPAALAEHDPGGLEVLAATADEFAARLRAGNHTLKRVLTDPRVLAGIGNAYSDEILHAARLSPLRLSQQLDDAEMERLYRATRETLLAWLERLRAETGDRFPETVTAFRPGMAVHGRFGQPCPACGSPVQRLRSAEREVNYCATCQTGGRLLADRAWSRLLRSDWPRTLEEWEGLRRAAPSPDP